MAPKTKFSRERIIQVAFEIAREHGMESITIRKVAEVLGSSIAPIYVNFVNVEELKKEVVKKVTDIGHQMVEEQDSGNAFYDIGIASLRFAKEYSVLFRDLVITPNDYIDDYDETMGQHMVEQMKTDPDLQGLSHEELANILLKMRVFQTGLSVMVASGMLPNDFNEEQMLQLLESTASDVIAGAHLRKNGDIQ